MSDWRNYGIEADVQVVRNGVSREMKSAKQNLTILSVVAIALGVLAGYLLGRTIGIIVGVLLIVLLIIAYCAILFSLHRRSKKMIEEVALRAADRLRTGAASPDTMKSL